MTLDDLNLISLRDDPCGPVNSDFYTFTDQKGRLWHIYHRKMWVATLTKLVKRTQPLEPWLSYYTTVSFTRKHTEDFLKTLEIYALME